jgi:hypothetical protein
MHLFDGVGKAISLQRWQQQRQDRFTGQTDFFPWMRRGKVLQGCRTCSVRIIRKVEGDWQHHDQATNVFLLHPTLFWVKTTTKIGEEIAMTLLYVSISMTSRRC